MVGVGCAGVVGPPQQSREEKRDILCQQAGVAQRVSFRDFLFFFFFLLSNVSSFKKKKKYKYHRAFPVREKKSTLQRVTGKRENGT